MRGGGEVKGKRQEQQPTNRGARREAEVDALAMSTTMCCNDNNDDKDDNNDD